MAKACGEGERRDADEGGSAVRVNFAVGMGRNERIYEIADHSRVAEESGFRHITFGDVQNCTRDLYVKMAMAATSTSPMTIGSGVAVPYTRHPVVVTTAHPTIHELSGGRTLDVVGSGPFKLVEFKRDQHIIMERNENFFVEDWPYLDRIVMRIIKDGSARAVALENGEVHLKP